MIFLCLTGRTYDRLGIGQGMKHSIPVGFHIDILIQRDRSAGQNRSLEVLRHFDISVSNDQPLKFTESGFRISIITLYNNRLIILLRKASGSVAEIFCLHLISGTAV